MPWFKIDDGFWSHPKMALLSDGAIALWVRAGAYCAQHLTDGAVSQAVLRRMLGGDPAHAVELVESGMWDAAADGWVFHDWSEYQPTREQVLAERAAAVERKRKSRESRRESQRSHTVTHADVTPESQRESRRESQPPDPTRPDPTRPMSSNEDINESEVAVAPIRDDVTRLLDLLDEELRRNGSKVPARTKRNVDAARLLLDRDGRTEEQVANAIRWCQSDEFWRANILSMSKLREKFDTLRQQAHREQGQQRPVKQPAVNRNIAAFNEYYGGNNDRAGSVPALDPGISA